MDCCATLGLCCTDGQVWAQGRRDCKVTSEFVYCPHGIAVLPRKNTSRWRGMR